LPAAICVWRKEASRQDRLAHEEFR
jgi:hypothetical protein